jgi:hypothetical protein
MQQAVEAVVREAHLVRVRNRVQGQGLGFGFRVKG